MDAAFRPAAAKPVLQAFTEAFEKRQLHDAISLTQAVAAAQGRPASPLSQEHKALALYDFSAPRLFVDGALAVGAPVPLTKEQSHYLSNVLRLGNGDPVLAFNGRDGEWRCRLTGRKAAATLDPAPRACR